jgi:hypothetical protein
MAPVKSPADQVRASPGESLAGVRGLEAGL